MAKMFLLYTRVCVTSVNCQEYLFVRISREMKEAFLVSVLNHPTKNVVSLINKYVKPWTNNDSNNSVITTHRQCTLKKRGVL